MGIDVTSLHNRRAVNRWDRVSVGDIAERLVWSYPDQEALIGRPGCYAMPEFERLTYRQVNQLTAQLANGLLSAGLHRGDRVLLYCENSVEAFLAKLAIARAGLVCVPINPTLAPDVLSYLIGTTEPRFAIVEAGLWERARAPFEAHQLRPGITIPLGGDPVPGSVGFAEFAAAQPVDEPDAEIHGDDIWQILFTSGTTALPKGAMISHSASYFAAYNFALTLTRGIRLECDLRLATFLPIIYHIGDQLFTFSAFLSGGTLIIGRKPDPVAIAEAISQERVTALWNGSPAMANALAATLGGGGYSPESLKVLVYGWAALPPETLASFKRMCGDDFVAVEIFGQTEAISCHRFWPDKWPEIYQRTAPAQNYVGVPSPLLASTVMDENGAVLTDQPWVPGEAVYRSPSVTAGYYRDKEATEQAFRFGWFHSGDSCVYDENGLRVMVDRFKDIVKSGGENVSSIRVESVLHQHPAVAKVAVVGLPHERWGEAVTAVVVKSTEVSEVTAAALIAHCRQRLAGFETPKDVLFVDELPETVGGKVLKYKLRQRHHSHYT